MVAKIITPRRNVIDFARYQKDRSLGKVQPISPRLCRYCGAALLDGENEDECSSALNEVSLRPLEKKPRRFYAD
jgi:hypothetical protein